MLQHPVNVWTSDTTDCSLNALRPLARICGLHCCGARNMQCMQACLRVADMELLRLMLAFAARPPVQGHLQVTLHCAGQPIVTVVTQIACDMPCQIGC